MIVVSDTSGISNLQTIGCAGLLPALFGRVAIPPAVLQELQRFHNDLPPFLEVIALALELRADRLLLDEAVGRAVARREGLRLVGVVGVLLAAKRRGPVPIVRPLLDRLRSEAGFRISRDLHGGALREAGE